jgi:hypothetical protein
MPVKRCALIIERDRFDFGTPEVDADSHVSTTSLRSHISPRFETYFGLHKLRKQECSYHPMTNGSLTFPVLVPGEIIEPLSEQKSMHLMDQVLDPFCKLLNVKL